jgi:pimeloyl-ACP methyl ester carboxylesterase
VNVSSPRRARRLLTAIAGLGTASVLLSGCLYSIIPDTAPASTVSPTPDVDGVAPDLLPFYEQSLDWEGCGERLDCTMVTAPLDWANPGDGEIELALIRSRAEGGEAIGSLLTNPGGPGVSGVSYVREALTSVAGDALRQEYDVIGFDPRGVGRSTPVTCDLTSEQQKRGNLPPYAHTAGDVAREAKNARTVAKQCATSRTAWMLPHTTTANTARDMDRIRTALGEPKLSYLGGSYGSYLGAVYTTLFPGRSDRIALDSNLGPGGYDVTAMRSLARGMEDRFPDFAAFAAAHPA